MPIHYPLDGPTSEEECKNTAINTNTRSRIGSLSETRLNKALTGDFKANYLITYYIGIVTHVWGSLYKIEGYRGDINWDRTYDVVKIVDLSYDAEAKVFYSKDHDYITKDEHDFFRNDFDGDWGDPF